MHSDRRLPRAGAGAELVVGVDSDRACQTLWVVAWSGVGYAAYGLATIKGGSLTATFVNRNTAASYFGSHALCGWSCSWRGRDLGALSLAPASIDGRPS